MQWSGKIASPDGGGNALLACSNCQTPLRPGGSYCSRCGFALQGTAGDLSRGSSADIRFGRRLKRLLILTLMGSVLVDTIVMVVRSGSQDAGVQAHRQDSTLMQAAPTQAAPMQVAPPSVVLAPAVTEAEADATASKAHREWIRTASLGGTGGAPFETKSPSGQAIVGFRIRMSTWDGLTIVQRLEPVYAGESVVPTPGLCVARPGYAVGALVLDGQNYVTAMRVEFMRITGLQLDPKDSYQSDWFGEPHYAPAHRLGGWGQPVVGIFGRRGLNVDALGLILLSESN